MDRRTLLGRGVWGGGGLLVTRPVLAGPPARVADRLRQAWARDRRDVDRELPPRLPHTHTLHAAIADGLGALGVVKALEGAPDATVAAPEVQSVLREAVAAVGRAIRLSADATEDLLAADDRSGTVEPVLRRGLRSIREDLHLWRTTVGNQRKLEAGLDEVLHPPTPGLLRLRLRATLRTARRAERLALLQAESHTPDRDEEGQRPVFHERSDRQLGMIALGLAASGGLLVLFGVCEIQCGGSVGVLLLLVGVVALIGTVGAFRHTEDHAARKRRQAADRVAEENRANATAARAAEENRANATAALDSEAVVPAPPEPLDPAYTRMAAAPPGPVVLGARHTLELAAEGWVPVPVRRAPDSLVFVSATGRVRGPGRLRATPFLGGDRIEPLVVGLPPGVVLARVGHEVMVVGARGTMAAGPDGAVELAINAAPGQLKGAYAVVVGVARAEDAGRP